MKEREREGERGREREEGKRERARECVRVREGRKEDSVGRPVVASASRSCVPRTLPLPVWPYVSTVPW